MPAEEKIRLLNATDVSACLDLSALAGWNQTADDWRMLLRMAPEGCFGLELSGRVVATATLVCYGRQLGWIGMVLTHPEFRGRGCATKLFEQVLRHADAVGICTLKLDATDQGKPLYEKYGFRGEQPIERWGAELNGGGSTVHDEFEHRSELDRNAFGVSRSGMLRELGTRGNRLSNAGGYVMTRPGRVASYLGPCVAADAQSAKSLLFRCLQERQKVSHAPHSDQFESAKSHEWYWDLLPENDAAVELATEFGFTPRRKLTRMFRGKEFRGRDELVYAIAGFELG